MKKLPLLIRILIYLFCWPAAVLADNLPTFSASGPEGKVTLTAEPCLQHPWLKNWQVARWIWKGKPYEACWRLQNDGQGGKVVVVLDAGGDIASFEPTQFVKDEGV